MKINRIMSLVGLFMALCCCKKPSEPLYIAKPALRISTIEISSTYAKLSIESINAIECRILCVESSNSTDLNSRYIALNGLKCTDKEFVITDLKPQSYYTVYGVAIAKDESISSVYRIEISTIQGPKILYDWEKNRKEKPTYSNLALCYGGSSHRKPLHWDVERISKHVSYTDTKGVEHWLFDAFLAIEFVDTGYNMEYAIGYGRNAADKASWMRLLDYWFDTKNGFAALNEAVREASERIGTHPKSKRKVIITLPDPIIHKESKNINSTSLYWGFIDGYALDFKKSEDRLMALKWYIDEVRSRWNKANYEYLEFIGFYIVSEDLATPGDGWNPELKRWEDIFPKISEYIHACNETLTWIPYNSSAGYKKWKEFGIDFAMMQPNYFWHSEYDMNAYMSKVMDNGLSMEFEFDEKILESSNESGAYRTRFYKYMDMCHQLNLYGKRELSYYFGSNEFYNISVSTYPLDQKLYHDLCNFIINSAH